MKELIVISGPPGSGKSTLARRLAAKYAAPLICDASSLAFSPFNGILEGMVCLILENVDQEEPVQRKLIKTLTTQLEMECHRKGRDPKPIPTPKCIILISEEPWVLSPDDRRVTASITTYRRLTC